MPICSVIPTPHLNKSTSKHDYVAKQLVCRIKPTKTMANNLRKGKLQLTRKARRGQHPPRASPGACGARGARGAHARSEKRPPRARRPALPQPFAAVLSAKAGLTAGFGMGPGDPRLCGRARGGRSPAAHDMEPAWVPCPGRPWRPHGGHGRRWRIALGALIEDAKSSGY